jgi:hypothetical protein
MVQIISEKQIQTMFKLVFVMSLNCTGTLFHISKSFFSVVLIWYMCIEILMAKAIKLVSIIDLHWKCVQ